MKISLCVFALLCLSCNDIFRESKIRVIDDLYLMDVSGMKICFLAKRNGSDYRRVVSAPIIDILGNDSVLIVRKVEGSNKDTLYLKVPVFAKSEKDVDTINLSSYKGLKAEIIAKIYINVLEMEK